MSSDQSADLYADRRYDRKLKHGADLSHCPDSPAVAEASRHIRRVVVDNGSSDDSLDRLSAGPPIVGNLGFARACNRGAAAGALNATLAAFEQEIREGPIGIVGLRLVDESGSIVPSCAVPHPDWRFWRRRMRSTASRPVADWGLS